MQLLGSVGEEPRPHLHAKTFLVLTLATCFEVAFASHRLCEQLGEVRAQVAWA